MPLLARLLVALLGPLALAACAAPIAGGDGDRAAVVVGIAAINDFHGALEPPRQSVFVPGEGAEPLAVPAGGAAWLAAALDRVRGQYEHHLTVSAGDLIGGSQFASALFLDEPAIGAMNRAGLEFNAVGNHEFDRGRAELLRIQRGGCEQHTAAKPCAVEPYQGASFAFLAANTLTENGAPLFPATALRRFGSGRAAVSVGLVGVTLRATPSLVPPAGVAGLTFADEAETINAAVETLERDGAAAIVVLIHQGGRTAGGGDPQACEQLTGEILPILDRLDPRVDVVVSGHTHWAYVCDNARRDPARPFLLTSAGVYGELVTDIRLEIDPAARRVMAKRAVNVIVQSEAYEAARGRVEPTARFERFAPRADIAAYVARYVAAAKAHAERVVGRLGGVASRPGGDAANTGGSLGNLIADAQLAATAAAGAQIAFTNPFGIRAPALLEPGPGGALSYDQLYRVQPFGNVLVTQSFTGAELKAILEQGFDAEGPVQVLSPSRGFAYGYDLARPVGERVTALTLNGASIRPEATYRVTTNNFLAQGGDSFTLFAKGRDPVQDGPDIAALEAWLAAEPPRPVPSEERTRDLTRR